MNCKNCGAKHGCTCKKRVASDGADVCEKCLSQYETNLKRSKKS